MATLLVGAGCLVLGYLIGLADIALRLSRMPKSAKHLRMLAAIFDFKGPRDYGY